MILIALLAMAAATAPTPADLHAGLAGRWTGALGYRDYQSDRLFELPVSTEFRALPDGVTELQMAVFDDGPKAGPVYITSLTLFDVKAGTAASTSFRRGMTPEIETEQVAVTAFSDLTHWTLTYQGAGADNGRPARLRVVETRDGDTLISVKEVAPLAPADAPFRFRNQTRLIRQP